MHSATISENATPTGQTIPAAAPPTAQTPSCSEVMPPARMQIVENEMAKFENAAHPPAQLLRVAEALQLLRVGGCAGGFGAARPWSVSPRSAARTAAIARSMPAASTSRWVTARSRVGAIACEAHAARRGAPGELRPTGTPATSKITMLVSTRGGSTRDARDARQRLGEAARVGVIVGEARAVVLERVERRPRRGCRPGACRRRASCGSGARARHRRGRPAITEPTGAPSPFEKQTDTVSNGAASSRSGDAARDGGVPDARAVEVQREAAGAGARGDRRRAARAARRGRRRGCACSRRATSARARQVAIVGQRRPPRRRRRVNVPSRAADLGELHARPRRAPAPDS